MNMLNQVKLQERLFYSKYVKSNWTETIETGTQGQVHSEQEQIEDHHCQISVIFIVISLYFFFAKT